MRFHLKVPAVGKLNQRVLGGVYRIGKRTEPLIDILRLLSTDIQYAFDLIYARARPVLNIIRLEKSQLRLPEILAQHGQVGAFDADQSGLLGKRKIEFLHQPLTEISGILK